MCGARGRIVVGCGYHRCHFIVSIATPFMPTSPLPSGSAAPPARKAPGRATIDDVARHAGVSKATVSRFLNRRDELLTRDIAARVAQAIEALDYKPSAMARSLKHGRTRLIGLVVADIANPFSIAVLRGAEQACQEAGYLMVLFNLGNEVGREREALRALASYQVEGLILNRVDPVRQAWHEATLQGKPVVLVDRRHEGLDADFVSVDNRQAVELGLAHLLAAGYEDFLLVTEPYGQVSSRTERVQAFVGELSARGRRHAIFETTPDNADALAAALRAFRQAAGGRPAAVLSGNAVATLRVAAALTAPLQWQFGRELGFVGFDETEWAPLVGAGLTTIAQPTQALGGLAARCLIERLDGLQAPARHIELPGWLIARGSSRPPA
ncbi:MAG: HTH-type transcriptional regulator KdgR [Paracidovorax wautersii]|uniref:HTH-type transcriptional regulator KdgR n=1 Tax=Paracidovorax wautersii TaxID=1177982 RepID=A0A7V8FLY0_9BURK|nr:MAG: HTH-type transcriptional regulator KdgR [Paracidovorax wautersii]